VPSSTKLSAQTRFRLKPDVAFQALGPEEESVVLSLESGQLYTGNPAATFFLAAVKRGQSLGEAAQAMSEGFEVGPERALEDLQALARELLAEGLVETVP
jgi:hypothetical protein